MKKYLLIIILFISILFTASCSSNNETVENSCNYCYIISTKQYIKIKSYSISTSYIKICDEDDNVYMISATNWILCHNIGDIKEV